jgi:predicted PurR-regulated permease PerM
MHQRNKRARQLHDMDGSNPRSKFSSLTQRTWVVVGIIAAVVLGLWLLWYAADVFLLIFAGVLVAVFLYNLSTLLSTHTPLSYGWALVTVVLTLVVIAGLIVWLWAPRIAREATQLAEQLPRAVEHIRSQIAQTEVGSALLERLPPPSAMLTGRASAITRITGITSTVFSALASLVVVLFVGLYLAINPRLYERGLVRLVPISTRHHARTLLDRLGYTLRWWMVGTISSMTIIGVLTGTGLWLIGIPLAVVLGLIAGLLEFIPNLGPILSAVPAVLLAYTQSPTLALWVIAFYIAVQSLESYLIHPLVFKNAVELPPAITISALLLFGALFGFLGLLLATPLAAVTMVLIKMLYVEDMLGDESVDVVGEEHQQTSNQRA